MTITPAVFIGLGATGARALDEIALGLAQGYGRRALEAVSLLGFDFSERQAPPPVQHLAVQAAIDSQLPALRGWFEAEPRDSRRGMQQRQVARAVFLSFLAEHSPERLDSFLQTPIRQLLAAYPGQKPVMTHLFAALPDAGAALLLDMVNFAYRALNRQGQETRLIVHLGLPAALKAHDYAALRELERFTISYGDTLHVMYPPGSGLEDYNAPSSLLIFGVKLYPAGDDLPERWADVLLPQMDGSLTGFAPRYLQTNIANWNAWRDSQIERTGDRYSLYAGSYTTRTALFPLERLRRIWTARLAHDTLRDWLGGASLTATDLWRQRYTPDGVAAALPEVTRWLLQGNRLPVRGLQHEHDIRQVLFESERSSSFLNALRAEHRAALDWLPTSAEFSRSAHLADAVQQIMTLHLGALDLRPTDVSPTYAAALAKIAAAQRQRFAAGLDALLWEALHGPPGVRGVLPLLQDEIVKPLKQAAALLRQAVQSRGSQLAREAFSDTLASAARRLATGRRWFSGDSPEQRDFFERARFIAGEIKAYHALDALAGLAEQFHETAAQHLAALNRWRGFLWEGDDSLLRLTAAEDQADWSPAPHRLWLVDMAWAEAQYQALKAGHSDALRRLLRWQLTGTLYLADTALTPDDDGRRLFLDDWQRIVRQKVDSLTLDLWADYLLPNNRYRALLPALQAFFSADEAPWFRNPFIRSEALIVPTTLPPEFTATLWAPAGLSDAELLNEDPTRIVRYSSAEVFSLAETAGFAQAQQAYRSLSRQQRARLHVLPAEVEAVTWETRARDQLNQSIHFSGSVVALFADSAAMQQFVRLEALGLIHRAAYAESGYALTLDGQTWWLSRGSARLPALTRWVFEKGSVPFGRPPHLSERPLPRQDFEAALQNALAALANERRDPHADESLNRVAGMLQQHGQATTQSWARLQAEEASALLDYHQRRLEDAASEPQRDERDLNVVLALMAKVLYDQILAALRSRVY